MGLLPTIHARCLARNSANKVRSLFGTTILAGDGHPTPRRTVTLPCFAGARTASGGVQSAGLGAMLRGAW
jgi:hypothetical protein